MIKIVEKISDANCITHSGTMHADEVFATAFLSLYKDNIKLIRTSNVDFNEVSEDALVYDIGRKEFDHHQEDRRIRDNGIPYCSFGLLWDKFGRDFLEKREINHIEEVWLGIDKDLVEGIDAIDNGVFPKVEAEYRIRNTADIIKLFNPNFKSGQDETEQFLKAVTLAQMIIEEEIQNIKGRVEAKVLVEAKIEDAIKNHYLLLDEYMPFEDTVYLKDENKEIYFVIFPSNRGGYAAKTIFNSPEDKTVRINFPEEWAGLSDSELEKASGVVGATFCHLGRFIVCANEKEQIIELVNKAIQIGLSIDK